MYVDTDNTPGFIFARKWDTGKRSMMYVLGEIVAVSKTNSACSLTQKFVNA